MKAIGAGLAVLGVWLLTGRALPATEHTVRFRDAKDFAYVARSYYCPFFTLGCDVRKSDVDWAMVRKAVEDWRAVAPCMLGDYYPLTAYSLDRSVWMAWQFDLPEQGRGIVQVFRRPESPYESARFPLRGLDPKATYEVTDLDAPSGPQHLVGRLLLEQGLPVTLAKRPGSAVFAYRRAAGSSRPASTPPAAPNLR